MIYENGVPKVIDEKDMPVELPDLPKNSAPIPLSQNKSFYNISEEQKRETDTFDTFMDSSWYYARFTSSDNDKEIFDENSKILVTSRFIYWWNRTCHSSFTIFKVFS